VGEPSALILVGIGGFLGAIARYVVGVKIARRYGTSWPFGTFVINVTGCLMIAFFLTLTTERITVNPAWRFLFPIGFVGAYTTFSTFEYETLKLIEEGAWRRAVSYVGLSTLVGFGAVWFATLVARWF
jgi:fluoride exporter